MQTLTKQITVATNLQKIQQTAKDLYGKEYSKRIIVYKNIIYAHIAKHKKPETSFLESAIEICTDGKAKDNLGMTIMFMSAACDLITENPTK